MILNQKAGVGGEFKICVYRSDGTLKTDTGFIKNLVLDNGLKAMGGLTPMNNVGVEATGVDYSLFRGCAIGTGNDAPSKTNIALSSLVAISTNILGSTSGVNVPTDNEDYVTSWVEYKYVFDKAKGNISEVGLVGAAGTYTVNSQRYENMYILLTRALIKGPDGRPLAVTVLDGETLEVTYRLNIRMDVRRKTGEFTLASSSKQFDYFVQPITVGHTTSFYGFRFPDNYNYTYSYGRKLEDTSAASGGWEEVTYKKPAFSNLISGSKYSYNAHDKFSSYYRKLVSEKAVFDGDKVKTTAQYEHGIYTHTHTNGIRAFTFGVSTGPTLLLDNLVVVHEKVTGAGIEKTDAQKLTMEVYFEFSRLEG